MLPKTLSASGSYSLVEEHVSQFIVDELDDDSCEGMSYFVNARNKTFSISSIMAFMFSVSFICLD